MNMIPTDSVYAPGRSGFTLIEMLIVISIIGVLAGLSVFGIQRVRESSLSTGCVSNMAQWGQAIRGYSLDWNGFLPSMFALKGETMGMETYFSSTSTSVNNVDNFTRGSVGRCPRLYRFYKTYPGQTPETLTVIGNNNNRWWQNSAYAASGAFFTDYLASNTADFQAALNAGKLWRTSQIKSPELIGILFCGADTWNSSSGVNPNNGGTRGTWPQFAHGSKKSGSQYSYLVGGDSRYPYFEDGKCNVLSFSGGVRSMTRVEITLNSQAWDENKQINVLTRPAVAQATAREKHDRFWNVYRNP